MPYTFTTTPSGSIQVSNGSTVVGTGSADFAKTYGYGQTQSTTADTTQTQTPTDTPTGRYPSTTSPATSPEDAAESTYQSESTPEDPAAIASRIQAEYAPEIQSIQNYYNSLLASQTTANTAASGSTRAEEAESGELGQDMGNAETANQNSINAQNLGVITDKENAAEGAVEGTESTEEESEVMAEKTQQQTATGQEIGYLSSKASAAQSQIGTIAGTTDLASLPQDEYDSLYEASGFATPEQFNTYYNAARQSAQLGVKTIGDATTGVWSQQADGSYKQIIPGAKNTIGDPTTGVWQLQSDGTYKNIITAQPKVGSIGAGGSYVLNPTTGAIQTIAPTAHKIVSSGGVIYSVDPSTNAATPLTSTKNGWAGATGSSGDQEKAAIAGYIQSIGGDVNATITNIQADPNAYYQYLDAATNAGYYTPVAGLQPQSNTDNTDAATNESIDSQDASTDTSSSQ